MEKCLVIYSTTDGHTKKICDHIASILNDSSHTKLISLNQAFDENLMMFDMIVIGASIRYGKHKKELYKFIKKNISVLEAKKNAFFSVNAVARNSQKGTPLTNPYTKKFLELSQWNPKEISVFAGKIDYPRYGFFDKHIIRFIMWLTSGPTDLSNTYDFTNWKKVEQFAKKVSEI